MIRIKHLMDGIERCDGQRLWVEPFGLTLDMRQWCGVDRLLPQFGPPQDLWNWFEEHPDGYDYFRATYHSVLAGSQYRQALLELSLASHRHTFTLLHQGDDPEHNTAVALLEFLDGLDVKG